MLDSTTPRWQYRFDNFKRAYLLLSEAMETRQQRELTQLEKEGIIQRFEYTMELAWKVMKDYLEFQNVVLDKITPRSVILNAFEAKLIHDGELWQNALDARNKMSHTYDFKQFEEMIDAIAKDYLRVIGDLYTELSKEFLKNDRLGLTQSPSISR
jgi:nucleotidyltransferase substrate binding protein (TIGR01987 family)